MKSKVIIEIRFENPDLRKKVLEDIVIGLAEKKAEFIEPLKKFDPDVNMRVWYEGFSRQNDVELPSIAKLFKKR